MESRLAEAFQLCGTKTKPILAQIYYQSGKAYEYIKLPKSSVWRHPGDALWINGRWNEFFDLLLLTSDFVIECFDSLQYAIAEGIIEEVQPPELVEYVNDAFVEHLTHVIIDLDKRKFARIET